MNQVDFNREMLSFEEKIKLAKLEASKALVRVDELEYQKARFSIDIYNAQQQEAAKQAQQQEAAKQIKPEGQ